MSKKTGIVLLAVASMAALAGACKKRDEIPMSWSGRYRRAAAFGLAADQFVRVAPKQLTVEECRFNCGENVVNLLTVACNSEGTNEECRYTSTHCIGTITRNFDGRLSITATPTPMAVTGEALRVHNETCNNIRQNLMRRQ